MNSDKFKGSIDTAQGKVKTAAGDVAGDSKLQAKGAVDKVSGAVKKAFGDVRENVEKAVDKTIKQVKK